MRKLIHIFFATLILLFLADYSTAQVVYVDVNPDETVTGFGPKQYDLDGDGKDDILFYIKTGFGQFCTPVRPTVNPGTAAVEAEIISAVNPVIDKLALNASISPAEDFTTGNTGFCSACIRANFPWTGGATNAYIGFRFRLTGEPATDWHYGWALLDVASNVGTVVVKEFGWESTVNTPILAGDKGSIPVTNISVQGQGGATTITTNGGTLQMVETVLPANATNKTVSWTIRAGGTGTGNISGTGLLTATGNGTVIVRATAQDGSGIFGETTITLSNQITLVTSISVQGQGGATTITTPGGTLQMIETVLPANATNQNVTWSVDNSSIGTISTGGLLTAVSNGSVTVFATAQDGSGVSGSRVITISNQPIPVTSISVQGQGGASAITTNGGTLQMIETVLPANATNQNVLWSTTGGTGSGTISGTGLLTAVTNGTVIVRATAQDGSGVFGETTITISNQVVYVSNISVQGQGGASTITTNGGTLQMEETVLPANATNKTVSWTIRAGGTGTGSISATGLLTAATNGTVIVRATAQDGSGVFGETTITISNQVVLVSSITVSGQGGASTITTNGGTLQMLATVLPANATNQNVNWTIRAGGTGTGSISATGLLTAATNGTVIVRATAQDGSGVFGETTITISNQVVLVSSITVSGQGGATTITTNGGTLQMLATVLPANASNQNVTWTIRAGGTGSGSISLTGLLTAATNGTVIVRATANDGSGVFGETTITISNQVIYVSNISVQGQGGASTITTNGGTLQMEETVLPANATNKTVSWTIRAGGTGTGSISATGLLTAATNGTVIVRATAQDGSGVFGETTITISNQVVLVSSITVSGQGGASTITTNGGTLQILAAVLPANATNQNVTWTITAGGTGSGSISGTGLLTAVTNGTVIVRATAQDGSGVFGETTITISNQVVLVSSITISGQGGASTITTNGGTLQMLASILPANATNQNVNWTIRAGGTGSGSISATGLLTAATNGTVIVRATAQDGSGVFGETTITISNQVVLVSSITVSGQGGASTITTNGGTLQMLAAVLPANATNQNVNWTIRAGGTGSGNISATGLLTATGNGTVIVRATAQDGSGVFGETTITISNQVVLVSSITVSGQGGASIITTNGGTLQMLAAVLPANASNQNVTWTITAGGTGSGNISATGLLTAVTNGTVIVRATAQDGSGVFGETTITISNQVVLVSSITISGQGGASTITTNGGTLQMLASILPANATNQNVNWTIRAGGTGSGSISATGLLTAVTNGTVIVRATAQDGSGVFGETTITISNQVVLVSSITVSGQGGASIITTNGGTLQMLAAVLPANASNQNVTWTITAGGTGSGNISATGLLTAATNGTVIVRATAQDGSGVFGETTITISNQVVLVSSITVSGQGGASIITTNGGTLQMLAAVLPANASNQNVTWTITAGGTGSGSISGTGLLTAVTNGTVIVRATAQDGSGVFGETTITISNQVVLVSSITVSGQGGASTITTNGGSLQMLAAVLPANATNQNVTWTITAGGTGSGSISGTGLLTAVTNGTVIVRATAQDGSGVFGETTITISNQVVLVSSITVSGQGGASTITTNGGTLQMLAAVLPANATNQNVTWTITAGGTGSGSISGTGLLTAVTNGTVIVRATAQDGSGVFGETTITISNQVVLVSSITVSGQGGASTITTNGGTLQMLAAVLPANATNQNVNWTIRAGGTGTGSISGIGLLTAVTNGTVIVRATAQDGSGVFGETTITISNQVVLVSSITVSGQGGASTITTNGGTLQMLAAVLPANATNQNVNWTIRAGGTGTGSISGIGLLTAVTNGTVIVRATAQDGSGVFGETTITISNQDVLVTNITVSGQGGASTITTNGGTLQMLAAVLPANATNQNVNWTITTGGTGSGNISATGLLTATGNGTVIVRATAQDGSGVFGETTITISNQTGPIVLVSSITVSGQGGASTITTNGGTLQMLAAVLPANATNQNVTWTITAGGTGLGNISATGLLTATGNGTVIVRATAQDGSGVFGETTITISNQVVLVTNITVSGQGGASTITTNGGTLQMLAAVLPANATNQNVTWTITAGGTGSGSISGTGLLTAVTNGTVIVRATANDGSGVFGEATITISNQDILVSNITVSGQGGASTITTNGGTLQMLAAVLPANATNQNVTWTIRAGGTGSGNISGTGLLTAVTNGTVIVRATANDGSGVFGEETITISNQDILVSNITVSGQGGASTITTNGGTLQMLAAVLPANATNQNVTWTITAGGTGSGSISGTGLLTAVTNGTVIVRATANDGSGVFGEATITISNQDILVSNITVSGQGGATTITTNGGTLQMLAAVLPANATNQNVTWTITAGGTGSGSISGTGLLTAVTSGTVIVRATANDGSGVFGEETITISNQDILVSNITVSGQGGASTITTNGGTLQMLAAVLPANATNQNVTWTITAGGTGSGSISGTGLLTAVTNGTVIVRATANDGSGVFGEETITISNQDILVSNITVSGQGGASTITTNGGTLQMLAAVLPANATNQNVTWTITAGGTGSGSISGTGLLTAVTNGTVIVRATANDGSGVFGEETITISNQDILVSNITVSGQGGASTITTNGGTLQMLAAVLPANATNQNVTWTIRAGGTGSGNISGTGLLTAVTNGTVIVRATANDGSGVFGEETITISNQDILVSNITVSGQGGASTITTNGGTLQMLAAVLPANATNQNVTWTITAGGTGSGSISGTGLLTAVTNGTVIVRATANDGSGVFGEATITISNQDILVSNITVSGQGGASTITTNNGSLQMLAAVLPANATNQNVTWTITAGGTGSGTINGVGLLTATGDGTVIVRATSNDGTGVFGEETIAISNQDILVTNITVSGQGGATTITTNNGSLQMLAAVLPANATNQNVTWTISSGTGSGTINSTGLLTASTNGTVTVRATANDGTGVFGEETITISNQDVLVSSITVQGQGGATTIATNAGTLQMLASVLPANAMNQNVTWTISGGTGVGTINGTGLLTARTNGTVIVRATANDGSGVFGEETITISNQIVMVTNITVQGQGGATSITTNAGMLQMIETVLPANATNKTVSWSVNNSLLATVNTNGMLTASNNGVVTVIATAQDGSGVTGSAQITISNQTVLVDSIIVQGQGGVSTINAPSGNLQMLATIIPSNAINQNVAWTVNDPSIAIVNSSGMLTAVSNGVVTVRATAQDGSGATGSTQITISNQPIYVNSITVQGQGGATTISNPGGNLQMLVSVLPTNATNQTVSWSVNNPSIATINTSGVLVAKANGVVTITATAQDGSGVSGSTQITISNQAILVNNITVQGQSGITLINANNGSLQMLATVLPANATNQNVAWSVNDPSIAAITTNGILNAINDGVVTVIATAVDGSGVIGSTQITISNQQILVTSIAVQGQGGVNTITTNAGALQMVASILPANATNQTVAWTVDDPVVAVIDPTTGVLTARTNGPVKVWATAQDGSGVRGFTVINISNQGGGANGTLVSSVQVLASGGQTLINVQGATLQMFAVVGPSTALNQTVTWSVSSSALAIVDQNGILTARGNGTVLVIATAQDGSGISGSLAITINNQQISVEEVAEEKPVSMLKAYPNPFEELLTVALNMVDFADDAQLLLFDVRGQLLRQESHNLMQGENIIRLQGLQDLPSGMYILQIRTEEETLMRQLIRR